VKDRLSKPYSLDKEAWQEKIDNLIRPDNQHRQSGTTVRSELNVYTQCSDGVR